MADLDGRTLHVPGAVHRLLEHRDKSPFLDEEWWQVIGELRGDGDGAAIARQLAGVEVIPVARG